MALRERGMGRDEAKHTFHSAVRIIPSIQSTTIQYNVYCVYSYMYRPMAMQSKADVCPHTVTHLRSTISIILFLFFLGLAFFAFGAFGLVGWCQFRALI